MGEYRWGKFKSYNQYKDYRHNGNRFANKTDSVILELISLVISIFKK